MRRQRARKPIPFNMGNRQKHGLFEKNRGRELRKMEPDCKKPRKIGHSCILRGLARKPPEGVVWSIEVAFEIQTPLTTERPWHAAKLNLTRPNRLARCYRSCCARGWESGPGVMKSWGWTFQFHNGFRCCLVARKRRNRPGARFASRGAAEVHSLAASAPGGGKSRGNHQVCWPEPPTGATDEREPDDRRVAIRHRQASPSAAPFGGSGSSLLGSGFPGLTPPGYELAPRTGLGKARQRKLDEHKLDARPTFHHPRTKGGQN